MNIRAKDSALPSSFHALVRQSRDKLTASDLVAFAAMRRRNCNRSGIVALVALLVLVALVFVFRTKNGSKYEPTIPSIALMIGCILSLSVAVTVLGMTLVVITWETIELNAAESTLVRLRGQDDIIDRVLASAGREPGVALFLRAFEVEYGGSSDEEIDSNNKSWAEQEIWNAQMSGVFVPAPADVFLGTNVWTVQAAAIGALQARLQVVMFDNITLSDSKRSELESLHVLVVPVIVGDWWPVFTRIANEANLIVLFIDRLSRDLRRETDHVVNNSLRYIVICSDYVKYTLGASDDSLDRCLLKSAVDVITYPNDAFFSDDIRTKVLAVVL